MVKKSHSLAQEESRSISENVKWGMRKKFSDGKLSLSYSKFLGYDKGPNGKLMIIPEQAEIVKRIFGMFLQGRSCNYIAKTLTGEGIPSPARGKRWRSETVLSILQNEKYKGDALLQKYFIEDFLTKKQKKNLGEIHQYYVEGDHEAIIEPATFDLVQKMVEDRRTEVGGKQTVHTFSRKIRCPDCGNWYGPKTWHSNSGTYRKKVWQCNRKYQNEQKCKSPRLDEEYLKAKFIVAANKFLEQRESKIQLLLELIEKHLTTDKLIQTKESLEIEIESLVHQVNQLMASNSRFTQDQEAYNQKYNELVMKYEEAQQKLIDTIREIAQRRSKKTESSIFLKALEQQSYVEEFTEPLFFSFVKEIKPYDISNLGFVFLDDTEITV